MASLIVILAAVFVTATLSGVFGMAGGLLLMGILLALLPAASAMVLHGTVQLVSNGARALLLRRHVDVRIVLRFGLGAVLAAIIFAIVGLRLDSAVILVLLGAVVLVVSFLPPMPSLCITNRSTALAGGFAVTIVQLLAGVSGPLLDLLFVHAPMDRKAVVATKATTQSLSHLLKVGIYATWLTGDAVFGWGPLLAACLLAALGARFGTAILARLSDRAFRRGVLVLVRGLAILSLAEGIRELVPVQNGA